MRNSVALFTDEPVVRVSDVITERFQQDITRPTKRTNRQKDTEQKNGKKTSKPPVAIPYVSFLQVWLQNTLQANKNLFTTFGTH